MFRVFRPDCYMSALNDYVKRSLELKELQPEWEFMFANPLFKTVVINMGSASSISNSSSMSRIHKNLFEIAKKTNVQIKSLNCNYLTVEELENETKNVAENFVLLKNVHLANKEVVDSIKKLSEDISGN